MTLTALSSVSKRSPRKIRRERRYRVLHAAVVAKKLHLRTSSDGKYAGASASMIEPQLTGSSAIGIGHVNRGSRHMRRRSIWGLIAVTGAFAVTASATWALEEAKDEKDRLKACEASLCQLVSKKGATKGDFTCSLQKTWAKEKIVEGAKATQVSWSFGDARCKLDLRLSRADVLAALGPGQQTFQFPEHTINCEIERDKEVTPVSVKLAPKVVFKDGQATTVWINLGAVEGPSGVKAVVSTVAKIQDSVGLFQKAMIKAINAQLGEKCAKLAAGG